MKSENIAAISTALAPAGVAVIRISGDNPLIVAQKVFKPLGKVKVENFEPNKLYVGEISGENFTDFGMCVYFKAPHSFTGENSVEFHCHGGTAIAKGILKNILSSGARLATNGEFTKRAFINGKLSLSSCEGLIDMINAESIGQVRAGYSLYREKLTKRVEDLQEQLTSALSHIEASIDFPEEGLEEVSLLEVDKVLHNVISELNQILSTYSSGRVVKNGVNVAIVGKPNTGKSSILNALLSYDKAIVSDIAGTTRDAVEGSIEFNGVRFNFTDTAGIRESDDKIEAIGVSTSKKILSGSDLIVFVLDGGNITDEDEEIYNLVKDKNTLIVINKTDKPYVKDDRAEIYLSATENINIQQLKEKIFEKTIGNGLDLNGNFLCEERHYNALNLAKEKLISALNNLNAVPLDLIAIDIKDSWESMGEISGKTATEDIINEIFSRFCVGK